MISKTYKKCRKCLKEEPLDNFYEHRGMKDGHLNICKMCKLEYALTQRYVEQVLCTECSSIKKTTRHRARNNKLNFCNKKCMSTNYKKTGRKPPKLIGQANPSWKGNNILYGSLHDWISNHLGKPQQCQHCNTTESRMYHWANKSGNYKRDLEDWIRLCVPCHSRYDKKVEF